MKEWSSCQGSPQSSAKKVNNVVGVNTKQQNLLTRIQRRKWEYKWSSIYLNQGYFRLPPTFPSKLLRSLPTYLREILKIINSCLSLGLEARRILAKDSFFNSKISIGFGWVFFFCCCYYPHSFHSKWILFSWFGFVKQKSWPTKHLLNHIQIDFQQISTTTTTTSMESHSHSHIHVPPLLS